MSVRPGSPRRLPFCVVVVLAVLFSLGSLGASCGAKGIAILPGVVNDPKNLSLRRDILAYGTSRMCAEMLRRGVPLKLRDEDPIIGRFYPQSCFAQELGNNNLFIQFGGYGYAWTNITKRMAFEASGAVEYEHDFLMDGSTMYVYFRQRSTTAAKFTTGMIEQPGASNLLGLPGAAGGQSYADAFGSQIMKNQIARGFTVIRQSDGAVEFGLGVVELGKRPASPYRVSESGRILLANERTEVHQNQREFVGPLEVTDSDQAIYLTVAVEGAPGVDVLVVPRAIGDAWLQTYTKQAATTAVPGYAALDEAVFSGALWRRTAVVPQGQYYVVFDNTATAGRTQPTAYAGDDRAAMISYALELGDAP